MSRASSPPKSTLTHQKDRAQVSLTKASKYLDPHPLRRESATKPATPADPENPRRDFTLFLDEAFMRTPSFLGYRKSRERKDEDRRQRRMQPRNIASDDDQRSSATGNGSLRLPNNTWYPKTYQGQDTQWKDAQLPPAPMPPRLRTPELDDIGDEFWPCCGSLATCVECKAKAYIAVTRQRHDHALKHRSSPELNRAAPES